MQKLAEICVARPVFALMLILALVVVGGVSYTKLGIDRFPDVDLPIVSVRTILPGASPEEVESTVTRRIEDAVATVLAHEIAHAKLRHPASGLGRGVAGGGRDGDGRGAEPVSRRQGRQSGARRAAGVSGPQRYAALTERAARRQQFARRFGRNLQLARRDAGLLGIPARRAGRVQAA